MKQHVIMVDSLTERLAEAVSAISFDRLFCLTDTNTLQLCWPLISDVPVMKGSVMITIGATDNNKTIESLMHVWESLQKGGATRHSLLVNLGGGMVTDLGGFAASTFKRGIKYINIPTSISRWQDWYQLRWAEERNRCVQPERICSVGTRLSAYLR